MHITDGFHLLPLLLPNHTHTSTINTHFSFSLFPFPFSQAFPVTAARAWNSLPPQTRAASSLLTFRWETKSHLFHQSFGWWKSGAVSADWQLNCEHEKCNIICPFFVKCPRNCCLVMVSLKSLLFKIIIIMTVDAEAGVKIQSALRPLLLRPIA